MTELTELTKIRKLLQILVKIQLVNHGRKETEANVKA